MKTFSDLGLAETLLRAVSDEGYTNPTPIQGEVIPHVMAGEDVLGIAQTGTGKTAAFVLPILHRIVEQKGRPAPRTCRSLILAPTRELAAQIENEIRRYSRFTRVSTAVVVGGVKPGPQVRALSRGLDILVATPGRLLDHMSTKAVDLSAVETVVLDEADQMLDLGFLPAIKQIGRALPKVRQTLLLSATMPDEIRRLAAQFQNSPKEVAVAAVSRPIEQIAQSVIAIDRDGKRRILADVLSGEGVTRAIVFTRTKHGADKVTRHLNADGLSAAVIHGDKSQGQRQRALEAFKAGQAPILVATDIAARGIHVDDVSHVVNYELPEVAEVYVHRIGRTARAGRQGIAVSLCSPEERKLLKAIERLTGSRLSRDGGDEIDVAEARPAKGPRGERPAGNRNDGPPRRRRRSRGPASPAPQRNREAARSSAY